MGTLPNFRRSAHRSRSLGLGATALQLPLTLDPKELDIAPAPRSPSLELRSRLLEDMERSLGIGVMVIAPWNFTVRRLFVWRAEVIREYRYIQYNYQKLNSYRNNIIAPGTSGWVWRRGWGRGAQRVRNSHYISYTQP